MADRIALNSITIRQAGLARTLEIAQEVGYGGVGLWLSDLESAPVRGPTLPQIAAALGEAHLEAAEVCFVSGWMYGTLGDRLRAREAAKDAFRIAEFLGAEWVVACASQAAGDLRTAAEDFAALCDVAGAFGVRCALEFLGGAEQVNDVKTTWEIVKHADRDNGGLLLDTFHFHKGDSSLEDLRAVPAEKIALVHVSDCQDLPRGQLEDHHRVFPGLGAIPLEPIIAALRHEGYRGAYSLEIFNQDYWDSDPYVVARDGLRSLARVGLEPGPGG